MGANFKIKKLLENKGENYILPFFWIHGEEEAVLREYMNAIHNCGIGAVCVESRPHPDFCGEQWWHDMDIILDETKKNHMKVWILDDSHFPTGYANGALENAPEELCRQGICYSSRTVKGKKVSIDINKFLKKKNDKFSIMGAFTSTGKKRVFSADTLLSITAIQLDGGKQEIDLTNYVSGGKLLYELPEGTWKIAMCKLSRNCGARRNYINMMDEDSCRILIEAVYEPHWERYKDEFGKTIAGFFSDEPELGNGVVYSDKKLGADQDLPWSSKIVESLEKAIGPDYKNKLCYLWEEDLDPDETARIRYAYMDVVTNAVKKAFSYQIGDWCRAHGVEYIGHVVEDNNQHARTGGSLGHYFRGLEGQDMAGIDDIGGQVLPQGEDGPNKVLMFMKRDGEFYHYILGKLGPSLAAIDATKKGRTMCEIFGNYGWGEGFRLEKYLADHFMVNGVNHFVPHAFSAKEYPDPDCPPHFYAHGHNPQYRHFGSLMGYMNRICELISDGHRVVPVALLYHGEAEWTGEAMLMQKPARRLLDNQIDFDILPLDVFNRTDYFKTNLTSGLQINTGEYKALVIPYAQYVSKILIDAIVKLSENNIPVVFVDALPEGVFDGKKEELNKISDCKVVALADLEEYLTKKDINEITIAAKSNRIRYMHYYNGSHIYYFINEADSVYEGSVTIPRTGNIYAYHAWDNVVETVNAVANDDSTTINLEIEPMQSVILVFDDVGELKNRKPLTYVEKNGSVKEFNGLWKRSMVKSIDYSRFFDEKEISFPDNCASEYPKFSGIFRYENTITLDGKKDTVLTITDAYEGVELFVNGKSAGIQVVPTYRFDITPLITAGENKIIIEVSTTLERERAAAKNRSQLEKMLQNKVLAPTGITGEVKVYEV